MCENKNRNARHREVTKSRFKLNIQTKLAHEDNEIITSLEAD